MTTQVSGSDDLLDEEWAYAKTRRHPAPGCTVVCVRPAAGSAPVMAQTMDILSLHDRPQAVVPLGPQEGLEALVFTYAGMIDLNGCNEAGISVVVNNLETLPTLPRGLWVTCIVRDVLEQSSLEAATAFPTRGLTRSASTTPLVVSQASPAWRDWPVGSSPTL